MVANQTKCSWLEQRLVKKFSVAAMCDVYGKANFSKKKKKKKKMFTNELNMGLSLQ